MSSQSFTASDAVDMSKEKDWAASIGMLDWDATNIVFTKRSLVEFLKYTGTTVDPNFTNIQKLPKYAQFGKISNSPAERISPSTSGISEDLTPGRTQNAFVPSRRVRTAPGGDHTDIFAPGEEDDALSTAPPRPVGAVAAEIAPPEPQSVEEGSGINFTSSVKPSRRVRTNPGGNSSLGNLWDADEVEQFKPSRRVRQGPGGQDHIDSVVRFSE